MPEGMDSNPENIFQLFSATTLDEESATLTPRFGLLVYESNEERIYQTGHSQKVCELFHGSSVLRSGAAQHL